MEQEQGSQENLLPQAVPPLRKGYYLTRGGYHALLDKDIVERGLGVIREVGYVTYARTGEFAYKSEPYENHPGDSLDLLIETWQVQPFVQDQEQQRKELQAKENRMKQRATILDIIEAGLWGNQERVRAYTELLIERIEAEQDTPQEERERDVVGLRKLLERRDSGDRGRVISTAQVTSLRTQIVVGSISKLAQEELQAAHATIERLHQNPPLFLVSLEHQEWYRTHDGGEYPDLEVENGRLVIHSQDLEVTYNRKPYDISQTTVTSIYEP